MDAVDCQTHGRGRLDTARRRFGALLLLSGMLHLLFTPWAAWLGLAQWFQPFASEPVPEEPIRAIPVDLVGEDPKPEPPTNTEPEPEPPAPEPVVSPPEEAEPDAPAVAPPEPESTPEPVAKKSEPAPVEPEVAPGEIGDPVALAGDAGSIADSNANVRLLLYNERIRQHTLGKRIGYLLRATPQWKDFFGPAGIDPIRDIDRVLIAGPQLRDSSNVVAVVQHALPEERIRGAVDALVKRGGGEWVSKEPPIARAVADRAERLFVVPKDGIVAVVPGSAEESARSYDPKTGFPQARQGVAVRGYFITPWRVFTGTPVQVPKSIEWARLEVLPTDDDGAEVRIVALDESKESARKNAARIEQMIQALSQLKLGGGMLGAFASLAFGGQQQLLDHVEFRSKDKYIHGVLRASREQLVLAADLVTGIVEFQDAERNRRSSAGRPKPSIDGGSSTSSPRAPRNAEPAAPSPARPDLKRPEAEMVRPKSKQAPSTAGNDEAKSSGELMPETPTEAAPRGQRDAASSAP